MSAASWERRTCGRVPKPRTQRWVVLGGALAFIWLTTYAPSAWAAGPPLIGAEFSSAVGGAAAKLSAGIDPNGSFTSYHFEYLTEAAYQANGGGFAGASTAPASGGASLGTSALVVTQQLSSLTADTTYRYRAVALNSDPASPTIGPVKTFTTKATGAPLLLDSRGWEMVSPVDKNGGQIDPPGAISGGGALQAAAAGDSVTYGSIASFAGGQGGSAANQYLSTRSAEGWATQNITAPISYSGKDGGVPYRLFTADLSRGLLFNGDHCASGPGHCTLDNPPLAGTDAPPGYQDYYLRENSTGDYTALLGTGDIADLDLGPADFDLRFSGASPDLSHVVLSSCAALVPGAGEVPQGSGCDPNQQNLYEWSQGAGLALINGSTPGAALAAQSGAVSASGDRVYWTDTATGDLYLHDSTGNHPVAAGADFQLATPDGATALYLASGDLHSYDATTHTSSAALASGVTGVLGASGSADTAYFQDGAGLKRWHLGDGVTEVAPGADAAQASDYPPTTGTVRVSADGTELLFLSTAQLTGYDNTDLATAGPDTEVYLYDSGASPSLACLSCNPTGERPLGPSTIPGAIANGSAPLSTQIYKPRVLSADGKRVFFDSADSLALTDTNQNHTTGAGIADVYEWEANGEGSCARAGGCISLVSSGRSAGGAVFVDASADGSDAFFITDDSLVSSDPGSLDLYVARIGGGFPVPSPPIACEGDACQVLTSPPGDPTLTTLLSGHGNPAVHYRLICPKGTRKHKGRCIGKHRKKKRRHRAKHHHKAKHRKRHKKAHHKRSAKRGRGR